MIAYTIKLYHQLPSAPISDLYHYQALAYEPSDHARMPLHTPKTVETCKKSLPCLIQKLQSHVNAKLSFTCCKTQRSYKNIFYFIGSVVKILWFYFLYVKDDRLQKHYKETWMMNYRFSDVFTYRLNLKNFVSLFFLIISCFK